jgi:ABC-type polysaccharide transport system, permease component
VLGTITRGVVNDFRKNKFLYLLVSPAVILVILFSYLPIFGIVMAFQNYSPAKGFFRSEWVWFENFRTFFSAPSAVRVIKNTFLLSLYSLLWSFPIPIIFALALNEVRNKYYKKLIQTVSILPNFLSNVIIVSMVIMLLSTDSGIVNAIISKLFYMKPIDFMTEPKWFRTIYIASGIWQSTGWNSIIYMASMASINPELYEAAEIDGAKRFQRIWHITIPSLQPTIIVLLILSIASLMGTSMEKVLLMQNPLTYDVSMTIETYTYKRGLMGGGNSLYGSGTGIPDYSYASAIGLWQSAVNAFLLLGANKLSSVLFGKKIF